MINDEMNEPLNQNGLIAEAELILTQIGSLEPPDHHTLCKAMTRFKNLCRNRGYSQSVIEDASFFIIALLDETVKLEQPLMPIFCEQNSNIDTEFFERLQRRQANPQNHIDLLELAYLCLSLGFRGQYRNADPNNEVTNLMDKLFILIRQQRGDPPRQLAVQNDENEKPVNLWRLPPVWLTALMTIFILITIFIPYNKTLNRYSKPLVKRIDRLNNSPHSLPQEYFIKTDSHSS